MSNSLQEARDSNGLQADEEKVFQPVGQRVGQREGQLVVPNETLSHGSMKNRVGKDSPMEGRGWQRSGGGHLGSSVC